MRKRLAIAIDKYYQPDDIVCIDTEEGVKQLEVDANQVAKVCNVYACV